MNNEKLKKFFDYLKRRLNAPLPGTDAHLDMMPLIEGKVFRQLYPNPDSKRSAILILLAPAENKCGFEILLTLRSSNLNTHRGQISCPGGRMEPGESVFETALRETQEETAFAGYIDIAGRLTDFYVPPSDSLISPVVGIVYNKPENLLPNPDEVEEIFFLDFDFILDENNYKLEKWIMGEQEIEVPLWHIGRKVPLWGATAMIISELIILYHEFRAFTS